MVVHGFLMILILILHLLMGFLIDLRVIFVRIQNLVFLQMEEIVKEKGVF